MRLDTTLTRRLVLPTLAVGALLFAACGDDDDTSTAAPGDTSTESSTSTPADSGGADDGGAAQSGPIAILDFKFDPAEINATPGQELTFDNGDGTAHTATATDNSFNTDSIQAGESGTATAPDAPGEYPFFCSFHPFMKGTVVVS